MAATTAKTTTSGKAEADFTPPAPIAGNGTEAAAPAAPTRPADELSVIRRICSALDSLDDKARARVVGYVYDRYVPALTPVQRLAGTDL